MEEQIQTDAKISSQTWQEYQWAWITFTSSDEGITAGREDKAGLGE